MTARLVLGVSTYTLSQLRGAGWVELGSLQGAAATLFPPGRRADEAGLEFAIEVVENWLMPHARSIHGEPLEVVDATSRLACGLTAWLGVTQREWSIDAVEQIFLRLVDLATGRHRQLPGDQHAFFADMLLVRELAHHAQLRQVRLISDAGSSPR